MVELSSSMSPQCLLLRPTLGLHRASRDGTVRTCVLSRSSHTKSVVKLEIVCPSLSKHLVMLHHKHSFI